MHRFAPENLERHHFERSWEQAAAVLIFLHLYLFTLCIE